MAGGDDNLRSCALLLRAAPDRPSVNLVLSGLEKAFAGRAASSFPKELTAAVSHALADDTSGQHLALGVRVGHPGAVASALAVVSDEKANKGPSPRIHSNVRRGAAAERRARVAQGVA